MALRKSIRKPLSNYCLKYIYECKCRTPFPSSSSWQGLPEILEIYCSIFQGLNVQVKPEYHVLFRNVIVPLHKSFHLDEFHEQLMSCVVQFVTKDPTSARTILGGLLKFWPRFSPSKEQLFIAESVHILNICIRFHEAHLGNLEDIIFAIFCQFIHCTASPHHQVAERAILIWREEHIKKLSNRIWPILYKQLLENSENYWLPLIQNLNRQLIADLKRRYPLLFEEIEKQQPEKRKRTRKTQYSR